MFTRYDRVTPFTPSRRRRCMKCILHKHSAFTLVQVIASFLLRSKISNKIFTILSRCLLMSAKNNTFQRQQNQLTYVVCMYVHKRPASTQRLCYWFSNGNGIQIHGMCVRMCGCLCVMVVEMLV